MKKYLSILLALALVLCLAACGNGDPTSSDQPDDGAQDSGTPAYEDGVTPTDLTAPSTSPTQTPEPELESLETLKVCGISIIKDSQLTGLAYKGVKFEDGMLILDAAELNSDTGSSPLIEFAGGDLEISVNGDCSLACQTAIGIKGDGNLSITGEGSLSISSSTAQGISVTGSLNVACTLNVSGSPAAECSEVTAGEGFTVTANEEASLTVAPAA